ncbi:MAG TPA: hypothetical protein VE242_01830 [Chthoniobacterales bacterium]|nr:hypothetical protein [Chthoniobacterales bacterium]
MAARKFLWDIRRELVCRSLASFRLEDKRLIEATLCLDDAVTLEVKAREHYRQLFPSSSIR